MITYHANFMGPISFEWFQKRGLVKEECGRMNITESWRGGRIDVYGTEEPYGMEISLPVMNGSSWYGFSEWLYNFKTETVYTLEQLVEEYEKNNPKIVWAHEVWP